ncbi:MAG: PD40 domain-containing protein [Aphanocapsa sp. GSE-SYN-MK-11-07L]|nr:PD40 domain-containing protein [Aphanocapsa sp. GSE-SYN-MK-11-07L]
MEGRRSEAEGRRLRQQDVLPFEHGQTGHLSTKGFWWLSGLIGCLGLSGLLGSCGSGVNIGIPVALNSRAAEHQPALSANGRWLAFVSDRFGGQRIYLYDVQQRQFLDLPGLNNDHSLKESPSLSAGGRYLVYLVDHQGRPEIALYDRANRRSQVLTSGYPGGVRQPKISPNGRYVVFESSREGDWNLEVLDRGPNVELDSEPGNSTAGN